MSTSRREIERQLAQENALIALGFTAIEANALRRISLTLHRWHELECGMGYGGRTVSIERDEPDSKPYRRVQYATRDGYVDHKEPIADRETGARKRLAKILNDRLDRKIAAHPNRGNLSRSVLAELDVEAYVQTDPRGAALYILRPGDVPEGERADSYYSRGICVY